MLSNNILFLTFILIGFPALSGDLCIALFDNSTMSPSIIRAKELVEKLSGTAAPNPNKPEILMRVQLYDVAKKKIAPEFLDQIDKQGFLNLHQTGRSGGGFNWPEARIRTEEALIGRELPKDDLSLFPKYGYLNVRGLPFNISELEGLIQYGAIIFSFKSTVNSRTTYRVGDTLFSKSPASPVESIDETSFDHIKMANFFEAEIWGELNLGDVNEVMVEKEFGHENPEVIKKLLVLAEKYHFAVYSVTNQRQFNQSSPMLRRLLHAPQDFKLDISIPQGAKSPVLEETGYTPDYFLSAIMRGKKAEWNNMNAKNTPIGIVGMVRQFANSMRRRDLTDDEFNFIENYLNTIPEFSAKLDWYGRDFLIQGLGLAATPRSIELLIQLLQSLDSSVRWGSITALLAINTNVSVRAAKNYFLQNDLSLDDRVSLLELMEKSEAVDEEIQNFSEKIQDPIVQRLLQISKYRQIKLKM